MSRIILSSQRFIKQPKKRAIPNPKYGIGIGLWNFASGLNNLIDGKLASITLNAGNGPVLGVGKNGLGYQNNTLGSWINLPDYSGVALVNGGATAILIYEGEPTGTSDNKNSPWRLGNFVTFHDEHPYFSDSKVYSDALSLSAARWTSTTPIASNYTSGLQILAVQAVSGNMRISQNGITVGTSAVAVTVGIYASSKLLGDDRGAANAFLGRRAYAFMLDNRRWTDSEIYQIVKNPWQLFEADRRINYFLMPLSGGSIVLSGAGVSVASATGAINQAMAMAGSAASMAIASGVVTFSTTLSGAAIIQAVAAGSIGQTMPIAGAAIVQALAGGSVTQTMPIAGSAIVQALADGSVTQTTPIAGSATAQALAAGSVSQTTPIAGAAVVQALATGSVSQATPIAGAATGAAAASATLAGGDDLSGAAQVVAGAAGGIGLSMTIAGAAVSAALAQANLTVDNSVLSGAAQSSASASAALFSTVPLAGAASAQVQAAGSASVALPLSGNAEAIVGAGGNISISVGLSAAALAQVVAGATVSMSIPLAGSALAQALASADLFQAALWSGLLIEKYTLQAPERNYTLQAPA